MLVFLVSFRFLNGNLLLLRSLLFLSLSLNLFISLPLNLFKPGHLSQSLPFPFPISNSIPHTRGFLPFTQRRSQRSLLYVLRVPSRDTAMISDITQRLP